MRSLIRQVLWWIAVASASGCATKIITFTSSGGSAHVSSVPPDHLDDDGTTLGDTPLTIEVDKLSGKVVKFTQPGKLPAYWVVAEAAGDTTVASIRLAENNGADAAGADKGKDGGRAESKATTNRVLRLILRAYQALTGKRFQTARELADQAAKIDPELAAPQVIMGLALYEAGDRGGAKAALAKAQALDPEDKDIDVLLQTLR